MAAPPARSSPERSIVNMGTDLIEVTEVKVLGHYRLRLTFSDGRVGDGGVSDVRDKGNMFADLRDPDYFAQVRVDPEVGTIAWPNGLDFAPERLYLEAVPAGPILVFDSDALAHRLRELATGLLKLLGALADSIRYCLESRSRTRV